MDPKSMLVFDNEHKYINFGESLSLSGWKHAAHCVIYCLNSQLVLKEYPCKASILMQLRFDGRFGFPGGGISESPDIVGGLNRELIEEINLAPKFLVSDKNYLFSHQNERIHECFHFYGHHVSLEDFESIEKGVFDAEEYGNETMGITRVPLYTMNDGFGGLPAFLTNNFVGNARDQLLNFLMYSKLITTQEIEDIMKKLLNVDF